MIDIRGLGKRYVQGSNSYSSFRQTIVDRASRMLRLQKQPDKDLWALRDINLEINEGERVAIVGSNGAGKSTLLKILSQITPPTTGQIDLYGRVASLLEVGTGFHPELSGLENIYLNGSILGLTRKEINAKLSSIIEFSGVADFIDLQLKKFSSGMQLRLAFAVAAHLDPEILLIDEVLAVGDMEFQKKCLQKMDSISREQGRTILFVTHNMAYVNSFCTRGIYLRKGEVVFDGSIHEAVRQYSIDTVGQENLAVRVAEKGLEFLGITNRDILQDISSNSDLTVEMRLRSTRSWPVPLYFDIAIYNQAGDMVIHSRTRHITGPLLVPSYSEFVLNYTVQSPNLAPGNYHMTLFIYIELYEQDIILWLESIPVANVSYLNPYSAMENESSLYDIRSITYPDSHLEIK